MSHGLGLPSGARKRSCSRFVIASESKRLARCGSRRSFGMSLRERDPSSLARTAWSMRTCCSRRLELCLGVRWVIFRSVHVNAAQVNGPCPRAAGRGPHEVCRVIVETSRTLATPTRCVSMASSLLSPVASPHLLARLVREESRAEAGPRVVLVMERPSRRAAGAAPACPPSTHRVQWLVASLRL